MGTGRIESTAPPDGRALVRRRRARSGQRRDDQGERPSARGIRRAAGSGHDRMARRDLYHRACGRAAGLLLRSATRIWAAPCGADSTSGGVAEPLRLSATTPCCWTGAEAAVNTPGAPAAPPGTDMVAVTGTFEVSLSRGGLLAERGQRHHGRGASGQVDPAAAGRVIRAFRRHGRQLDLRVRRHRARSRRAPWCPPSKAGRAGRGCWRRLAGAAATHPACRALLVSRNAATTRPTLVRTCSATTLEFRAAAWPATARPSRARGTAIPVSVLPSSGPLSVKMSTSAVRGLAIGVHQVQLHARERMLPRSDEPEIGARPAAVRGRPSRPDPSAPPRARAPSAPVAWITTPPRAGPGRDLAGGRRRAGKTMTRNGSRRDSSLHQAAGCGDDPDRRARHRAAGR